MNEMNSNRRSGEMSAYQVYVLDEDGSRHGPPHIVMCDDDERATHYARQFYLGRKPIEVWDEVRCVIKLSPPKQVRPPQLTSFE